MSNPNPFALTLAENDDAAPAPAVGNPFAETLRGDTRQGLGAGIAHATEYPSDPYAMWKRQEADTGIPADVAVRNPEDAKRVTLEKRVDRLQTQDPAVAEWLGQKPERLTLAKDDLENMSYLEKVVANIFAANPFASGSAAQQSNARVAKNFSSATFDLPNQATYTFMDAAINGSNWQPAWLPRQNEGALRDKIFNYRETEKSLRAGGHDMLANLAKRTADFGQGMLDIRDQSMELAAVSSQDKADLTQGLGRTDIEYWTARGAQTMPAVIASMLPAGVAVRAGATAGTASTIASGSMGATTYAQAYQQARGEGYSAEVADNTASAQAIIEVLTEKFGLGKAFGAGSVVKRGLATIGREAVGEMAATVGQTLSDNAITGKETDWSQLAGDTFDSGVLGGLLGGPEAVMGSHSPAEIKKSGEVSRNVHDSAQDAVTLQSLTEVVGEMKLAQHSPEEARSLVQSLVAQSGATHVYVDAGEFQALYQSDAPSAALALTSDPAALPVALASGGTIRIPMEQYLTTVARSEQAEGMARHVRLAPERMSVHDLQGFDHEAFVKEVFGERAATARPEADATNPAFNDVLPQLLATNRYAPADAERMASVYSRFIGRVADITGQDVGALIQKYPLQVISDTIGDQLRRTDPQAVNTVVGPILSAIRQGTIPTQTDVYGPRMSSALKAMGGVQDYAGELAALDPPPGLLNVGGLTMDDALTRLTEMGYFQPSEDGYTVADLLNSLRDDLTGEGVYRATPLDPALEQFRQQAMEWEAELPSLIGPEETLSDVLALTDQELMARARSIAAGALQQPDGVPGESEIERLRAQLAAVESALGEEKRLRRTDPLTGMRNLLAYDEDAKLGWGTVVSGDMDGLKRANDTLSHEFGDGLLKKVGAILMQVSEGNPDVRVYHKSGDEFVTRATSPEAARAVWDEARRRLENVNVEMDVAEDDGIVRYTYQGIGLSYGIGESDATAERELKRDKAERFAAGIREDARAREDGTLAKPYRAKRATDGQAGAGGDGGSALGPALYQSATTPEDLADPLVVMHNLSAENLLFADRLGALPVPSIGIAKADKPFSGFGDITLIGRQSMAEPSRENPVFSTDAWTQRFPNLVWPKVATKKAEAFLSSFGESYQERSLGNLWDYLVNTPNPASAIQEAQRSSTFMRAWLTSQGEKPVDRVSEKIRPPSATPYLKRSQWVKAVEKLEKQGVNTINLRRDEADAWQKLTDAARAAMDAELAAMRKRGVDEHIVTAYEKAWEGAFDAEDGGLLKFGPMNRGVDYAAKLKREPQEDNYATELALRKQIGDRLDKFNKWAAAKVQPLFGEPKIEHGRKTLPLTLDNVVSVMTSGNGVAGREKSLTFGAGKAAAANARRFQTIEEIKADRDHIVGPDEHKQAKESAEASLNAYRDAVLQFSTLKNYRGEVDVWDSMDAAMKALADTGGKAPTVGNVSAALRKNGFSGVDPETLDLGVDALVALRSVAADYLEAKPQRAVGLSEFAGAVIPDNTSPEVREVLERAGLAIQEIPSGEKPEQRRAAISKFSRDLHAASGDVLFQPGAKGSIQFPRSGIGNGASLIRLAETANASTFLHEMGHFFLEVMQNEPALAGEFARVEQWFGLDAGQWQRLDFEGRRKYHEQFARGFEAYLGEGVAPSPELKSTFRRFKDFIISVYRDLTALDVNLTPDIRGVFDRLLATEDEITAARDEQGMAPALPVDEARKLGMSEVKVLRYSEALERARESLAAKLLNAKFRETKAWYRKEVRKMRETVDAESRDLPVYRTIAALTEPGGLRLDRDELAARYGGAFLKENLLRHRVYATEGGSTMDQVADALGWESGDQMVQAIANAQPRKAYVRAEADARVREQHGDPMTDGTVPNLAMEAIHNSKMAAALDAEIELLSTLAGKPAPRPGEMREAAEQVIASTPGRALRPGQYLVAERKAARVATTEAGAGRYAEALVAKRQQALNAALYRAALKAEADVGKIQRYVRRFRNPGVRGDIGKAGGDYLDQIDQLLAAYEFTPTSGRAVARRKTLAEWYDRMVREGKVPSVPDAVMRQIQAAGTVNFMDVPVSVLRDLRSTLRGITALADTDLTVRLDGERRTLEDAAVEFETATRASLTDRGPPPADAQMQRTWWAQWGSRTKVAGATLIRLETLANWIDGSGNVQGPFHRFVIRPLERAQTAYLTAVHTYAEQYVDLLAAHAKATGGLDQRFRIASINQDMTRAGIIAVALNTGNADNLQRVREGRGWGDVQMAEILSHMTAADWQFVQQTWDMLETLWPQIAEQQRRLTGVAPPKVQAIPVTTPFGEFRGGYYPIQYDRNSPEWQQFSRDMIGADGLFDPEVMVSMPQNGHTKARVQQAKLPVKFDLQAIPQHLSRVLKDLTHRETLIDIQKLTKRPEVTAAVQETLGSEFNDMIAAKLRHVATDQVFQANKIIASGSKVMWAIRRRIGVAAMGLNTITALKQTLGMGPGAEVLAADNGVRGARYVISGYMDLMRHWGSMLSDVSELSGEMRHRLDTANVDVMRTMQDHLSGRLAGGPLGAIKRADSALVANAYIALRYVQTYAVDLPLWYGAYRAASELRGLQGDDAVAYADSVVRRSQGSGGAKDTAIVEGLPGLELFTMFYSYGSAFLQRQVTLGRDLAVAKRDGGMSRVAAELPLAAARLALVAVIPVLMEEAINQAIGSAKGPDDEDDWLEYYGARLAAMQFYGVPGFRDLMPSVLGASAFDARLSPAQSAVDAVSRIVKDGKKIIGGEDVEARKVARDAVAAASYSYGLPLMGPWKSVDYAWRVMEGDEDPDNLAEFTAAFLAGKREEN